MAYTLNVQDRGSYFYITVTGENSYESVRGYLSEALEKVVDYENPQVLLVADLTGPILNTFGIYDLVSQNSEKVKQLGGRIAYVNLDPNFSEKDRAFVEDVAVNRGMTVKVFTSIQAAQEWIEKPVP